jgi:hypothetical protein
MLLVSYGPGSYAPGPHNELSSNLASLQAELEDEFDKEISDTKNQKREKQKLRFALQKAWAGGKGWPWTAVSLGPTIPYPPTPCRPPPLKQPYGHFRGGRLQDRRPSAVFFLIWIPHAVRLWQKAVTDAEAKEKELKTEFEAEKASATVRQTM